MFRNLSLFLEEEALFEHTLFFQNKTYPPPLSITHTRAGKGKGGKGGKGGKEKKAGKGGKETSEDMFTIMSGDGAGKRMAELEVPINEKLIALGLQAHDHHAGVVQTFKADRGGQLLVYQPHI